METVPLNRMFRSSVMFCFANLLLLLAGSVSTARAEGPYFVTYDHHMEEPGSLEVSLTPVFGIPKVGNGFASSLTEFEYGVTGWWTTEFYLEGQRTWHESTAFTGFRWENRFRLLMNEHRINPVLYVEFEDINGADKTLKEVVGFDSGLDNAQPVSVARREIEREIETKLILSSDFKGWNVSENFIAEKNMAAPDPWEFGYSFGANRPLALAASSRDCNFCRENFRAGIEVFGGLGDRHDFTLRETSHYIAPAVSWTLRNGTTLSFSPAFGLTVQSHRAFIRVGISYEFPALAGEFIDCSAKSASRTGGECHAWQLSCSSDVWRFGSRGRPLGEKALPAIPGNRRSRGQVERSARVGAHPEKPVRRRQTRGGCRPKALPPSLRRVPRPRRSGHRESRRLALGRVPKCAAWRPVLVNS